MGLMESFKGRAEELKEKAGALAGRHNEQIDDLVDKAGAAMDKATGHKFSEKIEHGTERAKHVVDDFAHKPAEPKAEGGTETGSPEA